MEGKDLNFIRSLFRRYYQSNFIPAPRDAAHREFGFILFNMEGMIRHLSFRDSETLNKYLRREVPLHAFYSSAYYETPDAEDMDSKGWIGAELVFDIDADHIPTACKDEHDSWKCLNCGESGKGSPPETCPKCSSKRFKVEAWLCDQCLEAAKKETIKLVEDFLIPDFGFSLSDISFNFSGHRGYHIHVENDVARELSLDARREITDYIRGIGLSPKLHGFSREFSSFSPPDLGDHGWKGRLIRGIYNFVNKASFEELTAILKNKRIAKLIVQNREIILKSFESSPPRWPPIRGVSIKHWKILAEHVANDYACNIDERVTSDIKRLMRLPSSLHGKTGFKVKSLSFNELDDFNPLKDAVVFNYEPVKIHVFRAPRIVLNDTAYGPFNDEDVSLPLPIAIYMISKGAATLLRSVN
ncbi:MAG: DNA primase small subunit PriS [archaeon GB-1867-097]|nr:DNA primase small subunit PriS [Candidatus Culexmicrobium thermophilum]